jgi:hypothetical protein
MTTITQPPTPVLIEDLGMLYFNETSKQKRHYAVYQCECGKEFRAQITNVKRGFTKSCGCYNRKRAVETNTTHGLVGHPLHNIWQNMLTRTTNQNTANFKNYGARGYRGVSFHKREKKWQCMISINGKRKHLGYFETPLEAAIVYDRYIIENNLEHTRNGAINAQN